jgi:hypothetical protein
VQETEQAKPNGMLKQIAGRKPQLQTGIFYYFLGLNISFAHLLE